MGKGRTKFQEDWLEKELNGILVKEWLESVSRDVYSAKCGLCCETFEISGGGFAQVRSHHKGKKHLLKFNSRFKSGNSTILNWVQNKSNDIANLSHQNQIVKAETLWALLVAEKNISFKSCTDTVALFKVMFPDSPIASAMQLKERKTSYVLNHGISKYFESILMKDIDSGAKLTLAFDESTTVQNKHQLDMYARYWSSEFNLVTCRYLKSVLLGHATADIILKELLNTMSAFNIPLSKIICLSMDNPNVNKSVLKKFSEKICEDTGHTTLLPIGACNLHAANNAFKTLLISLELNFDEFSNDVHFFIKNSAVRREDFKSMEDITQVTAKFLLKHVNSRWLSAGSVAQRLFDQWANISEYFLNFLPKQKQLDKQLSDSSRYKRICNNLKEPSTLCFFAFIAYTHKHFEMFSLCFQCESPKIHLLFGEMNKLIRQVMMQFMKNDVVAAKEGTELRDIEVDESKNWKHSTKIEIGMSAKECLIKLNQNDKKKFLLNVRSALIKTVKYLRSHFPYYDQFFKDLELFHPGLKPTDRSNDNNVHALTRIARYMNFSNDFIDSVREEWKLFIFDGTAHEKLSALPETLRIDEYWREIFLLKDKNSRLKYQNLSALIRNVFILPHGNSDPERGFSTNKAMVHVNHGENTIVSLRFVKDTIRSYGGVLNVPITLPLLQAVKDSHKLYQEHVRKLKEEEEKIEKEKEQMTKEKLVKEDTKKRKIELDLQISENNKKIIEIKKNKELAFGLIKEGTDRLKKASVNKNIVEMTVAQNLISEGTTQIEKLDLELSVFENEKEQNLKKRLKIK